MKWQSISTAPKDGRKIQLLSIGDDFWMGHRHISRPRSVFIGYWWPEGDAWVDKDGDFSDEDHHLAVTGVWVIPEEIDGRIIHGWLQPNEVLYWKEI